MTEKLRKMLLNNLAIKILTLPLAAIIWIIIINIDDPTISRNYTNVSIQLQNTDAIDSLGKVYEILEGNTVNVTVNGKRSVLDKMKSSDLSVTADLKQMSAFNLIDVEVKCDKFSYADLSFSTKPKMLTVSLEDKIMKQFKVNVETKGSIDENYYIGSMEVKPNMIEVSGAKSVVERIADVRVLLELSGENKSFKQTKLVPKAYDANGKEINSSGLEFSHSSVTVKVNVQKTKVVPIRVKTVGTVAKGYGMLQLDYDPSQVRITGEEADLRKVNSVPIEIDITDLRATLEKEIMLQEFLPEGIIIVGNSNSIAVKVTIEKMEARDYTFTVSDIKIENLLENLNIAYSDSNRTYKVTIMGMKDDLEAFSVEQLGAYIDLSNLLEGVHLLAIKFKVSEKYTVIISPTISIELVDKNKQAEEEVEAEPEIEVESEAETKPEQEIKDDENQTEQEENLVEDEVTNENVTEEDEVVDNTVEEDLDKEQNENPSQEDDNSLQEDIPVEQRQYDWLEHFQ